MSAVISTNDGKQYQTQGFWNQAGAVTVGAMAGSAVKDIPQSYAPGLIGEMQRCSKNVDTVELRKGISSAMSVSGLSDKGVELIDLKSIGKKPAFKFNFNFQINKDNLAAASETAEKSVLTNFPLKKALLQEMPEWFRRTSLGKFYVSQIENMLTEGNNACYLPKANKIAVNIDKIGTSAFHEMGHAVNKNFSKFWRGMQKLRTPSMILVSVIPMVGLLKRKKVEGEEPKNIVDKVTTFIKDNCGKLTSLAFVPIVAEELKATQRGNKLAKQLLSPEVYKKVVKTNRFGAATYIGVAIFSGLAAFAGSKVRDVLTKPKEIKQG